MKGMKLYPNQPYRWELEQSDIDAELARFKTVASKKRYLTDQIKTTSELLGEYKKLCGGWYLGDRIQQSDVNRRQRELILLTKNREAL